MMSFNYRFFYRVLGATAVAIAMEGMEPVQGQPPNASALDPQPATGNIRDLEGLEERWVSDWFPQNGASEMPEEMPLGVNKDTYRPTVNDPQVIRNQERGWTNNAVGEPKKKGAGIPLGKF